MSSSIRAARVADTIQKELSLLLYQKVSDPRLSKVHITDVEVSSDLAYAKIYVHIDDDKEQALQVLNKARSFFRKQLAPLLKLRLMPDLKFQIDNSQEQYQRIESLLAEQKVASTDNDDNNT